MEKTDCMKIKVFRVLAPTGIYSVDIVLSKPPIQTTSISHVTLEPKTSVLQLSGLKHAKLIPTKYISFCTVLRGNN